MINHNIWTETLPKSNRKKLNQDVQLDPQVWSNTLPTISPTISPTIPKNNSNNSIKKYTFLTLAFIVGLIFVSAIKNETRNLEKELSNLHTSVNKIKFDLYQATLDHEVITSPENISRLANEYLDLELSAYKKNQIRHLDKNYGDLAKLDDKKNNKISKKIKKKIVKKIEKKKVELQKLQELYSKPEELPKHLRVKVENKIIETKNDLKRLYSNPSEIFKVDKAQKWAFVQVVKAFLGIPMIPGR